MTEHDLDGIRFNLEMIEVKVGTEEFSPGFVRSWTEIDGKRTYTEPAHYVCLIEGSHCKYCGKHYPQYDEPERKWWQIWK